MPDLTEVTLRDASSPLTAVYVPAAGMVGTSLKDDGVELLGQRRGLHAYLTTGNTMAPCVIIGERAAEVLRTEHKL